MHGGLQTPPDRRTAWFVCHSATLAPRALTVGVCNACDLLSLLGKNVLYRREKGRKCLWVRDFEGKGDGIKKKGIIGSGGVVAPPTPGLCSQSIALRGKSEAFRAAKITTSGEGRAASVLAVCFLRLPTSQNPNLSEGSRFSSRSRLLSPFRHPDPASNRQNR